MSDVIDETIKYLQKYGNTKESDLLNYLIKVKGTSKRTTKDKISKSFGKQLYRIIHPTKPPSVYLSLEPREVGEEKYTDLEPKRALQVARIDWFLNIMASYFDENTLKDPQTVAFVTALKWRKDLLVREGKALGR